MTQRNLYVESVGVLGVYGISRHTCSEGYNFQSWYWFGDGTLGASLGQLLSRYYCDVSF